MTWLVSHKNLLRQRRRQEVSDCHGGGAVIESALGATERFACILVRTSRSCRSPEMDPGRPCMLVDAGRKSDLLPLHLVVLLPPEENMSPHFFQTGALSTISKEETILRSKFPQYFDNSTE